MSEKVVPLKSFFAYAWGTIIRPGPTFRLLLSERRPFAFGVTSVVVVGFLYTLSTIIGYINGFGAYTLPFLPIAADRYYLYQTFFTIAVFVLCTLVYASVTQLLSVAFGGRGNFENCVGMAGLALFITIVPFMWIPETIMFAFNLHLPGGRLAGTLGIPPYIDLLVRQIGTVLWQLVVVTIGLKQVQQYSWIRTIFISLIGFLVFELVFWTYIR